MLRGTIKSGDPVLIRHERVRGIVETKGYFENIGGDDLGVYLTVRVAAFESTIIYLDDCSLIEYDEEQAIRDHDRGVVAAF